MLVITGFQIYWLRNNYERENQNLEIFSYQAFQETLNNLQVSKLHFKEAMPMKKTFTDTSNIVLKQIDIERDSLKHSSGKEILGLANAFRVRMMDSSWKGGNIRPSISIVIKQDSLPMKMDSFYVSMLSEKYKKSSLSLVRAFINGLISNLAAKTNPEKYSSVIYIFQKK